MFLLKASAVLLFTVACYADSIQTPLTDPKDSYKHLDTAPEPANKGNTINPINSTTKPNVPLPTTHTPNTTSTSKPNTTTSEPTPPITTSKPNTTTSTTPVPTPPITTSKPNTTTSTTPVPPSTPTPKPSPTPSPSPNTTTTVSPDPAPEKRNWDGPSFLGGMVLAFGIVAVGFVGYRFFYLGRGGAYHTL